MSCRMMDDEDGIPVKTCQLMVSSDNVYSEKGTDKDDLDLALMTQPEPEYSSSSGGSEIIDRFEANVSGVDLVRQPAKGKQPCPCSSTPDDTATSTALESVYDSPMKPSSSPSMMLPGDQTENNIPPLVETIKDDIDDRVQSDNIDVENQNHFIHRIDEDEKEKRKQSFLRRMEMKQQAIHRSSLHLCDNSHSFIYNETNTPAMNDDDEPGLPFIGPDLREQYEVLRALLQKGLLGSSCDEVDDGLNENNGQPAGLNQLLPQIKSNVSAILMGPRGHGKSLVLERCLASLSRLVRKRKDRIFDQMMKDQQVAEEMYSRASFRVVRLNGLLFQGDSAVACTQEIARQIGVMSREERRRTRNIIRQKRNRSDVQYVKTPKSSRGKRKRDKSAASSVRASLLVQAQSATKNDESHDLRIRRSGFNTYIALLDEVLRTAQIDGIPVLIVLEELDTFLAGGRPSDSHHESEISESGNPQQEGGSNDRQLLLYHLLDRVADHKFLVSFVGMTTDLTAVTRLEKRVQSRAEGTSKLIYFGHNSGYDDLVKCLIGKLYTPPGSCDSDVDEYNEQHAMLEIRGEVEMILRGGESDANRGTPNDDGDDEINDYQLVQRVFQRNYNLRGSDMRWVCRVFEVALGLLASDIDDHINRSLDSFSDHPAKSEKYESAPQLNPNHVARALVTMGASLDDISDAVGMPGIPTQGTLELIRWGQLIGDPKHYSCLVGTHSRLLALLGLSGPQVAVLLAARRIEARDVSAGDGSKESESSPLTYQRIQDEFATSFVASGRYTISSDRYPLHVLYRSCTDLMELGIISLKRQVCGRGALQYGHNDVLCCGTDISNFPLHVNLDWDLEFICILKAGLLQCSTALREWGLKIN